MKLSSRQLVILLAIAIITIILFTLAIAPTKNQQSRGSTYGRAPQQYGAWYAYMEEQGATIERWEKPFEALIEDNPEKRPITFLRILPLKRSFSGIVNQLSPEEKDWVKQGNSLVLLGIWQPVTDANFSTLQESSSGEIKIQTRRRKKNPEKVLLGDEFGAIVWQESLGRGKIILCTTPYLAANAYQDSPGNYQFLSQLVLENNQSIVKVDEYIQGYKDRETITEELEDSPFGNSIFSYLAQTPFFPAFIQLTVVLLVLIFAGTRRFGTPVTLSSPQVNNSQAYIQALAEVLHKAENSAFVLEVVGKEEQLQLQKSLGLGNTLLDSQSLVEAWVQQTGRPASELEQLLQYSQKRQLNDTNLLNWLEKWEKIRAQFLP